jgi:hypothetical protein
MAFRSGGLVGINLTQKIHQIEKGVLRKGRRRLMSSLPPMTLELVGLNTDAIEKVLSRSETTEV